MSRAVFGIVGGVVLLSSTLGAQANRCSGVLPQAHSTKATYVLQTENCKKRSCQIHLNNPSLGLSTNLKVAPGKHKLMYMPALKNQEIEASSSVVLFQVTHDSLQRDKNHIRVERGALDAIVSCSNRSGKYFSVPFKELINYKAYDNWHRDGGLPSDGFPYELLRNKYHFWYKNNSQCKVTSKTPYLYRFLFEDRDFVSGPLKLIVKFFTQKKIISSAIATDSLAPKRVLQTSHYRVASIKDEKRPCVEGVFELSKDSTVKVNVDDIEGRTVLSRGSRSNTLDRFKFIAE